MKILHPKKWLFYLWPLLLLFGNSLAFADPTSETAPAPTGNNWHLFPVPIFKTTPGEGQTYGLMPVLTSTDNKFALKSIITLAETYNKITGVSTFSAIYLYPTEIDAIDIFGEVAQNFTREATIHYFHRPKTKHSILYEGGISYLVYPFERFFGFGPQTPSSNETNFVSQTLTSSSKIGYLFTPFCSASYALRLDHWRLRSKAIPELNDTQTTFAGNPEVVPSTNLTHRFEVQYDSHLNPVFSNTGEAISFSYLVSSETLGSDFTFHGYDFSTKLTRSLFSERMTTVFLGQLGQRFGDTIPFYLQSSLGGAKTLRAFVERRFSARHRFSFDIEERIEVVQMHILDTDVALSLDPFFSLGQVFNSYSDIQFNTLQPVGGFGIRMKAKPIVVGRLDMGFGREGFNVYATIDYPF